MATPSMISSILEMEIALCENGVEAPYKCRMTEKQLDAFIHEAEATTGLSFSIQSQKGRTVKFSNTIIVDF